MSGAVAADGHTAATAAAATTAAPRALDCHWLPLAALRCHWLPLALCWLSAAAHLAGGAAVVSQGGGCLGRQQ